MVFGAGLSVGLPFLLIATGVPIGLFGQMQGLFILTYWAIAIVISVLAGLIAGFVRPGKQGIKWTTAFLLLTDILFLAVWFFGNVDGFKLVYTISAAIKVLWLVSPLASVKDRSTTHLC